MLDDLMNVFSAQGPMQLQPRVNCADIMHEHAFRAPMVHANHIFETMQNLEMLHAHEMVVLKL